MIKEAVGRYRNVRAITLSQAIDLAKELFDSESTYYQLWLEVKNLLDELDELYDLTVAFQDKRSRTKEEIRDFNLKIDSLWYEIGEIKARIAAAHQACIPDWRAMNIIAADREDGVYCFVWIRKEVWFYDGEFCPDPDIVEVVWRWSSTNLNQDYSIPCGEKQEMKSLQILPL